MNKTFLGLLLMAIALPLVGQFENYTTFTSYGSYIALDEAERTILHDNLVWDDEETVVDIGFDFTFLGQTHNQLTISTFGRLLFGDETFQYFGYNADLWDLGFNDNFSRSFVSYLLEETASGRVFKVEFHNAGFFSSSANTSDFTSFQIWLHEGSNIIETRTGPNNISDTFGAFAENGTPGPAIGLAAVDGSSIEGGLFLVGNPLTPNGSVLGQDIFQFQGLDDVPPPSLIYSFVPVGTDNPGCRVENPTIELSTCDTNGEFIALLNMQLSYLSQNSVNVLVSGNSVGSFALSDFPLSLGPFQGDGISFHSINVSTADGCGNASSFTAPDCITSIQDFSALNAFDWNWNQGELKVIVDVDRPMDVKMQLVALNGTVVWSGDQTLLQGKNTALVTEPLNKGIYLFHLSTERGEKFTKSILID